MKRYKGMAGKVSLSLAVLFIVVCSMTAQAEGERAVGTVIHEGSVYAYVKGVPDIQSGSVVQIGNVACDAESISTAALSALDTPMRTIVLVDNSKSIPEAKYAEIQAILTGLVENKMEGEQIRIGTVSDELSYLCDFSADSEALKQVIGEIAYHDQDTYLSDVLYSVISELKNENTYVYTRILVIADGADNKAIGYTNEEVRGLIEKNPYPVYTIGIYGKNNDSELETLFSFSRAASADYFLLDGSVPAEEIVGALMTDQGILCVKVDLPENLKDGSNKNILLKLTTSEGEVELVTNADMPFGEGITDEVEPVEEPVETLPTIVPAPAEEKREISPLLFAGIGVAAVLLIVLTVLFVLKKKKDKEVAEKALKEQESQKPVESKPDDDRTEYMTQYMRRDHAKVLWGSRWMLTLQNTEIEDMWFQVPIEESVVIGRREGDIVIADDKQISRKHCEIILRGSLLYVKDLDSKNGTEYENVRVHDETPIVSGGLLKIGKYTYRVELTEEV